MRLWLSLVFEPWDQLIEHAQLAENLGFAGVVLPDHVVVTHGEHTAHPRGYALRSDDPYPDALCTFAAMSAVTTRLRFMTYVNVVPLRDPFTLAKQAGTVAVLSDNRMVLGVGVGWLKEEFDAVGRDWHTRGARTDEMLDIMTDFWDDGYAEYHGRYFDFPLSGMFPVPTKPIPIIVGGLSLAAARRAARYDGYIPMRGLDTVTMREFEEIDALRERAGTSSPFERMLHWPGGPNPQRAQTFKHAGITGVVVNAWPQGDPTHGLSAKHRLAEEFVARTQDHFA
jgi:probable F420-dependent oxidoreductase